MTHQSMSGKDAQTRIDAETQRYAQQIRGEALSLADAHSLLMTGNLDLFQIAGLAKAIACFQCSAA